MISWLTGIGLYRTLDHCLNGDYHAKLFFAGTSMTVTIGYWWVAYLALKAMRSHRTEVRSDVGRAFYAFIWTFILCSLCGYVFDVLRLWIPAYNLFSILKLALIVVTYQFIYLAHKTQFFERVLALEGIKKDE